MLSIQRGFTIVELMVGLTLALLITLGVANIYLQTRQTFRTQTALTRLAEDGKYAVATLQRMIYQAGYLNTGKMKSSPTVFTAGHGMSAATVLNGTATSLNVRFWGDPDGNVISCAQDTSGNSDFPALKAADQQYGYTLYVENNQLKCAKLSSTATTSDAQVLADNVVDFKLSYGVDTDGDRLADTYKNTGIDWSKVYAIRACLVVKSQESNIAVSTSGKSYLNCNFPEHSRQSVADSDGHLYRTFSNTIYLRNKVD
jgi:type IV pilus assembly protein PilW